MQIQMREGARLGRGEAVPASMAHEPLRAKSGLQRTSLTKNVIEEGERRDLIVFVSTLISYRAPGAKGSVVVGPGGFTE